MAFGAPVFYTYNMTTGIERNPYAQRYFYGIDQKARLIGGRLALAYCKTYVASVYIGLAIVGDFL
jgi:hypothetical protein